MRLNGNMINRYKATYMKNYKSAHLGCKVKIDTPLGEFYGESKVHPEEDSIYISSFFGMELAEYRAVISYINYMIKMNNFAQKTLLNIIQGSGVKKKAIYTEYLNLVSDNKSLLDKKKALIAYLKDAEKERVKTIDEMMEDEK